LKPEPHDVLICRLAFQLRLPDAVPITLARIEDSLRAIVAQRLRRVPEAEIEAGPAVARRNKLLELLTAHAYQADDGAGGLTWLPKFSPKADIEGPTPYTLAQIRRGRGNPLLRLHLLGHIDNDQLRAAFEIAAVVAHLAIGLGAKGVRLPVGDGEWRHSRRYRTMAAAEWFALVHIKVYKPWADRIPPRDRQVVLALVIDGKSVRDLRKQFRLGRETVLAIIQRSLAAYTLQRERAGDLRPPGGEPA
jgi:hypothetical protein